MRAASSVERKARSQAFARFQQPVETPNNERRATVASRNVAARSISTRVFTFGSGQLVNAPPHGPRPPRGHPDSRFDFRFKRRTRLSNKVVADLFGPRILGMFPPFRVAEFRYENVPYLRYDIFASVRCRLFLVSPVAGG